ncbi:carboxylating nicotinate-nucleotide diphosphorylase [Hydrogenovibrio sp. 3SP14C1]|uniref:carboxylating nicotinate-nucleotide diphosphorylase n=1 Tax=Hydrogenovibrio sp. 3SP14C1 TaxID=3038774 RepID=UPI002417E8A8|nr:carboxylating nicotinate-nucleotide diphosphorylase [Hydrogenovibrio sp. 3SP14C1]MDG4813011.1 carboxylating nicotinate-nucleotide diphosphorylase [Hydrogenovibrio sp. 3SP14C1]
MTKINYFKDLQNNIETALAEDVGPEDLTASLIPDTRQATAQVIAKEAAVICGRPWFDKVIQQINPNIEIEWFCEEGQSVPANTLICELRGQANSILTAERSALNFLQTLSATATITQKYVEQLQGLQTQLLDTRKTLPGLRLAQKYAVHCGGGTNHRIGLYDAILIKENHIMAAGSISKAVTLARKLHPNKTVEVETETLDEVKQAVDAGADIIMLDNFSLQQLKEAVQQVDKKCKLEASGNVELQHLSKLAQTGVDYISTGAITKNIQAIDFSMRFTLEDSQ